MQLPIEKLWNKKKSLKNNLRNNKIARWKKRRNRIASCKKSQRSRKKIWWNKLIEWIENLINQRKSWGGWKNCSWESKTCWGVIESEKFKISNKIRKWF